MNTNRANFETHKQSAEQTGRIVNERLKTGAQTTVKAAKFISNTVAASASSLAGSVYGFVRGTIGKAQQPKRLINKE